MDGHNVFMEGMGSGGVTGIHATTVIIVRFVLLKMILPL